MLSPVVLGVLREYARVERPYDWLFPVGHRRDRHITPRAIQREARRIISPIDRLFKDGGHGERE
ncbi:MAG: hypothetical protein MUO50_09785 [Longimicrobiales bacterium]|nr:hypothetical protein [Longimicrobiales bacterium]